MLIWRTPYALEIIHWTDLPPGMRIFTAADVSNEFKIDACDLFDGAWIHDPTYVKPAYDASKCGYVHDVWWRVLVHAVHRMWSRNASRRYPF